MKQFIDREKATKEINDLLAEQVTPWMVLAGAENIGKTAFAQNIVKLNTNSALCTPELGVVYAYAYAVSISLINGHRLVDLICEYAKVSRSAQDLFLLQGIDYVSSITENQVYSLTNALIRDDISSSTFNFAHYMAKNSPAQTVCVFLDDFHLCDWDSYTWILEYWKMHASPKPIQIAVCNFELRWESERLLNTFQKIIAPVDIAKFDSEGAYYDILKERFEFENDINLVKLSEQLFTLFDGSARLLFETIKLFSNGKTSSGDNERTGKLLKLAQEIRLHKFTDLSKSHMLVLRFLSFSPAPVSKACLGYMLDLSAEILDLIISNLYESNYISQIVERDTGRTLYCVSDEFLKEIINSSCNAREGDFFRTKIYRAIQQKRISANLEQTLELALDIGEKEAITLLEQYYKSNPSPAYYEKIAYFLEKLLRFASATSIGFASIELVQILYTYGFYHAAEKMIYSLEDRDGPLNFENTLLLGDIQHVLLSPSTSSTYEKAHNMPGIGISNKLKALNRRIMALNQEHQEDAARKLYVQAFHDYEGSKCVGLVELYRNSNNSFGYEESISYTLKGYTLANELGENLEAFKCLHNICMLQLQYGHYGKGVASGDFSFIPTFEQVLDFFESKPEYRHEQAYPLLDLGTVMMFEYAKSLDRQSLLNAKKYYSQAQLYAKSFYAQHIAETGLLIVNSYLYASTNKVFVENIRRNLERHYAEIKNGIADHRVHRKILLSLALSAIISENFCEAEQFLKSAQQYITGAETIRYNKLCKKAGCIAYQKPSVSLSGKYAMYYGSDKFVPWLISFCH